MAIGIERKRQARGEARIHSLMAAAESVFARAGYSKATTNEIAAEAGVSPATLYQFFQNKEELADALAIKYTEQLEHVHAQLDYNSMVKMPMRKMVASLLGPLLKFHEDHRAFLPLLLDAPLSAETRSAKLAMSQKFIEKMAHLFSMRDSKLSAKEAVWNAEITLLVYKGLIHEIQVATGKRKAKLTESLVELIAGYLSGDRRSDD